MKRTDAFFFRGPALFFFLTLTALVLSPSSSPFAASPEQIRQAEEDFRALSTHSAPTAFLVDGKQSYVLSPALRAELECAEFSGPQYAILQDSPHKETDGLTRQSPALVDTRGTKAVFLNVKRDLSKGGVRPYVHGGLGVAYDRAMEKEEAANVVFSNSPTAASGSDPHDARLAWNAGLGVDMQAADDVQVGLGYRVAGSGGDGRDRTRTLPATAVNPAFSDDPSGNATHLFSVGVSIGF